MNAASPDVPGPRPGLTRTQWLICVIAVIGFAFDIYELLMLPLIIRPALSELGGLLPGTPEYIGWARTLFYVPAIAGGIFGLLGGYLTDLLGRRRMLTFSILLYAISAFFAGFSTSLGMLLFFRCLIFVGVCLEFVAAVAWLAELFDDPKRRERVLGYTQAFSSVGGLLVVYGNKAALAWAASLPAIGIPGFLEGVLGEVQNSHAAWRYTLMSGLIPALPLILIRPFLPESPKWQQKKAAGTLKRPSLLEIFRPELRRTTLVTTAMFACSFGAAFGAIQQMPQIVPDFAKVQAEGTARLDAEEGRTAVQKHLDSAEVQARIKDKPEEERAKTLQQERQKARRGFLRDVGQKKAAAVQEWQEYGGLAGRVLLAVLATVILSRIKLIRVFIVPGLLIMPLVFGYAALSNLEMAMPLLYAGIFLSGMFTVGQFSFWGNYLPRIYPVHLRGTGEGFAANIGGRLIGTGFAWVAQTVSGFAWLFPKDMTGAAKLAYTAAGIAVFVYVVNFVLSFFMTEPAREELPD